DINQRNNGLIKRKHLARSNNFGNRGRGPFRKKEPEHRINENIRVPEVRLVGDNVEQGLYPTRKAIQLADELELDLVEISPNATPPVCKIRSEEHTSELQSRENLVCRLLLDTAATHIYTLSLHDALPISV